MKKLLIILFSLTFAAVFAQKAKPVLVSKKSLTGYYEFKKQEIKNAIAYSVVSIRLNPDMTYVYNSSSHILGGYTEEKGTWHFSNDTLYLKESKDQETDKYLINRQNLCSIPDPGSGDPFCLKKKK